MYNPSSRIQSAIYFWLGLFLFSTSIHAATADITVGQAFSLSVSADGTAPFSYQWYHDGVAMTGATGSVYTGTAVASDAGAYYAKVTNSAGSTNSDTVTLALIAAPAITTNPSSQSVIAGGSVTFTVAANGTPAPTYQWRKNGVAISGATSATYILTGVTLADAASYSAVATNRAGSATSASATLTVNAAAVAPTITTQPSSQTITVGGSVTFSVVASGSPSPTYQWRKSGVAISGATSASYSLSNVTSANAASYSVVVTNSAGSVTSANATLTVNAATSAPVFTTQPSSQSIKTGSSVTFSAAASGSPAPSFQWRKNGVAINGATAASYTIASVSSSSAGTYTVVASNTSGSVTSSGAVLTVTAASSGLARTDFNADGKTDILWQNMVTRQCAIWFMNGTKEGSGSMPNIYADQWKMTGTGDFSGDGQADILCQNVSTGELSFWLMSGASVSSKVSLGVQSLDWTIGGIGDFNGDGRPDILVQNGVTQEVQVWFLAGTTLAGTASLGIATDDWEIRASGDFNGDGKSDILWQNVVTGQTNVWLMAGTTSTWKAWVTTRPLEWQVAGTGDFNGDGKSDILWQNVLTGECSIWMVSGNSIKGKANLTTQTVDWVIRN